MMERKTGGKVIMSAIMLTLGPGFAVLCGETMFCLDTGVKSKIGKVKMVEDKFLYGFVGRNTSAVEFFDGMIDLKLNPKEQLCQLSFEELVEILDERYKRYERDGVKDSFDVCAILCGEIDKELRCIEYHIKPRDFKKKTVWQPDNDLKLIGAFMNEHWGNYAIDIRKKDIVKEIMRAFQDMINKGVKIDDSINNEMEAYFINRGKDRPYITQKLK